jgi:hypothetical protein
MRLPGARSRSPQQRADKQWMANEAEDRRLSDLLKQHEFPASCSAALAGDAATVLQQSLLSARYGTPLRDERRAGSCGRLASARPLPSISGSSASW